jgi:uncharacterized protein YfaT (DUF1175 family)
MKCLWKDFEDTNGVIRICKSEKNRKHNGQRKQTKGLNDQQMISSSSATSGTRLVAPVTHPTIGHEWGHALYTSKEATESRAPMG